MPDTPVSRAAVPFEYVARWAPNASLQTIHANQLFVASQGGGLFYLVFGEAAATPVPAQGESGVEIPIQQVARIVISAENMARFAEAINHNLARAQARSESGRD